MNKTLSKITFLFLLLLSGLYSCVPTDTSRYNPNEKVFCDISVQLNANDNRLKSEVRFYIKDTLDSRPYFLDQPVQMNGLEMDKKFMGHKGVYYSMIHTMENDNDLKFSFTNLDDRQHEINVPLSFLFKKESNSYTIDEIASFELKKDESIILIDSENKIFDISEKRQALKDISLGNAQMVHIITRDSTFQLKGKLWVTYNSKSLSSTQNIEINYE